LTDYSLVTRGACIRRRCHEILR